MMLQTLNNSGLHKVVGLSFARMRINLICFDVSLKILNEWIFARVFVSG